MNKPVFLKPLRLTLLMSAVLVAGLSWAQSVPVSVSNSPLIVAKGTPVKPNLMLVIDDSGSMAEEFLPEAAGNFESAQYKYGHRARQCNGLAFNAAESFSLPLTHQGLTRDPGTQSGLFNATIGTSSQRAVVIDAADTRLYLPAASNLATALPSDLKTNVEYALRFGSNYSYTAGRPITLYDAADPTRWLIGRVKTSTSSTNKLTVIIDATNVVDGSISASNLRIASNWPHFVHYDYLGGELPRDFTYSSGTLITDTTFYKQCDAVAGSTPTVFKRVLISDKTANSALRQKFADWYAHYRTREAMMKTVISQAFVNIDDSFRIGVSTIHASKAVNAASDKPIASTNFLGIQDFDGVQKEKFYRFVKEYSSSGYTPNRAALSFTGRYFANVAPGQTADPMQYACQKNFAMLATDGAWNSNDEDTSAGFGPQGLAKKGVNPGTVGNQDGGSSVATVMKDHYAASNTMADVSYYFNFTDIRDGTLWGNCTGALGKDVCDNRAAATRDDDPDQPQRMMTYTMSLGQNGSLRYQKDYDAAVSGDFYELKNGSTTKRWRSPTTDAYKVDDLWHAAVNGGGIFFNANNAADVSDGLRRTLADAKAISGSGTAAATSSLYPVEGNNAFYIASFSSPDWYGDLRAYKIDTVSGALRTVDANNKDANNETWPDGSAGEQLNARTPSTRKILVAKSGSLVDFTPNSMDAAQLALFGNRCSTAPVMSHCLLLPPAELTEANKASQMVEFLRGSPKSFYRTRAQVLGDIVNSSPVFDGNNRAQYSDAGYDNPGDALTKRDGVIYAGANDGMMHAFDAKTGAELWAFIPTTVMKDLYRLADRNYDDNHRFFVDGSAVIGDVYINGGWRRILVFGLGAGGKTYVALDVTNRTSPSLLWEFSHADLGLTHARPTITKRKNGTWVVAFPSGLNNGKDEGFLFVLNAATGAIEAKIGTGTGTGGLGPVSAWVDEISNNTATRFYAGDNVGNLWRFDIDNNVEPYGRALKLATLKSGSKAQPISTRPVLTMLSKGGASTPVVFVGTGRLVGTPDLSDTSVQTIYAIRDPLADQSWGDVQANSKFIKQTLVDSGGVRGNSSVNPVDWTRDGGWYVDLKDPGERINIAMALQGRTLIAASNVPSDKTDCRPGGGTSWLYALDVENGGVYVTETKKFDTLLAGITAMYLPDGSGHVIVTKTDNSSPEGVKTRPNVYSNLVPRRANWRELSDR